MKNNLRYFEELPVIIVSVLCAWFIYTVVYMAGMYFLHYDLLRTYFLMACQSLTVFLLPALFINRYLSSGDSHYLSGTGVLPSSGFLALALSAIMVSIPPAGWISDIFNRILSLPAFSEFSIGVSERDIELKTLYDRILLGTNSLRFIANIIVIAFLPALCEEFFFRGIMQNFFVRNVNSVFAAILFASVIFSLAHFQASEFFSRSLMGFVLGYSYFYGKSIWIPVSMHFLNNLIALVFYPYGNIDNIVEQWWIALPAMLLLLMLLKKMKSYKNE